MFSEPDFRAKLPFAELDPQLQPIDWLADQLSSGAKGALLTITGINGGAPRPVGTQMAVLSDGRFSGQISGGCVEPAIAAEAQGAIAASRSTVLTFGRGAKAIDIRFPCGGGVDVLVHPINDPQPLYAAKELGLARKPFILIQDVATGTTSLHEERTGVTRWRDTSFETMFWPKTRVVLIGRGQELEITARLALASGHEVHVASPARETVHQLGRYCSSATHLTMPGLDWPMPVDPWTATVLLFHDHDWEMPILQKALAGNGFYIGALGSPRTHRIRCQGLAVRGVTAPDLDRIRAPIGLLPRSRDPATLAISILAEIAKERNRL